MYVWGVILWQRCVYVCGSYYRRGVCMCGDHTMAEVCVSHTMVEVYACVVVILWQRCVCGSYYGRGV